ncbi:MAG TPA: dephospho-CoA kinase [Gammaproteobacteria bacterium]|nr:dephospho-CoA kinase [Gammaproteobacteria bacterium]
MSSSKQLWVLAGGNGAGKSTFYQHFLAPTGLPFINADIMAKELVADHTESVSYKAAILTEKLRFNLLHSKTSFCFETVFSHPSKIDFIATAKSLGYEIILVYIHLQTDQLNQARVAQRVMQGGHNVPIDKIISRIPRTLRYVRDALPLVDVAKLYDNSSHHRPFLSVALLKNRQLHKQMDTLPEWAETMLSNYSS